MNHEHLAPRSHFRCERGGRRQILSRSSLHVLLSVLVVVALGGCGDDSTSSRASKNTSQASDNSAAGAVVTTPDGQEEGQEEGQDGATTQGANPCDLLTEAEMEGLFGEPVESTEIPFQSITTSTQCLWNKVSESVGDADALPANFVLVQIPVDEYDLEQLRDKIAGGGIEGLSFPVDGVGDGAVMVVGGEGISVVVGESGFHLRTALNPDPTDEVIKALAVSAAGRMAQNG